MSRFAALNFKQWIDDNRDLLKPPVGNQCVYNEDHDFLHKSQKQLSSF